MTDEQRLETMKTLLMYNIILTNDVATGYVYEFLQDLEVSPFYKRKVKFWTANVRKAIKAYNTGITKRIEKKYMNFMTDVMDEFNEPLGKILQQLYYSAVHIIYKHKVPNAELLAKLSLADGLVSCALQNVDNCTGRQNRLGNHELDHCARGFRWLRLTGLHNAFRQLLKAVEDATGHVTGYYEELYGSREIETGFRALANELADSNRIIEVANSLDHELKDVS